ncbi:MAG TPA: N-acetyl-gamma-glutamyl-phosphate reductase [Phycisphaerae bacterium]|nr:N-acetyl-gamma-glutamyl-phosphate reductase [Phycisphaerae bacterium]
MKPKIFVDGQEGTTGLQIHELLATRSDLEILRIDADKRKDPAERKKLLNAADLVFLCLPDAASRQAVALIDNPRTRIIDASTAFRTDDAWVYGLPEIQGQREKIKNAARVANPGCHATAFVLAVRPLVDAGIIPAAMPLTAFSLTGYSGGGKKMIAAYEASPPNPKLHAPRHYALNLHHKHLPEMQKLAGLSQPPLFTPVVCDLYKGLAVQTFLPVGPLAKAATAADVHAVLSAAYRDESFVRVMPLDGGASGEALDDGQMDITACNDTNRAELFVFGDAPAPQASRQIIIICRLDNLGKGASGAALQNMNVMLGFDERLGLRA